MEPIWRQNIQKLVEENVSMVTIQENQIWELMGDYEDQGLTYPEARQIIRSAWNLNIVGNVIRAAVADYMEKGRFGE